MLLSFASFLSRRGRKAARVRRPRGSKLRFRRFLLVECLEDRLAPAVSLANAGFESGLTGWTTSGNVSVATNHTDHSAPNGSKFALMESGTVNVYNTVSQSFAAQAGQTITGYAFFHTTDYMPYNDDGRIVIKSGGTIIATLFSSSVSQVGNYGQTNWVQWQYTFSQSGTYTLEAGVRNIGDSGVSSYLGVDLPATSDTIAPTISLDAPADNALVHGIVSLQASASDSTGVAKVDFYVDESLVGSDTDGSDGWSFDLNTTQFEDGEHTWWATASDAAGNQASAPARAFTVDNTPPSVSITAPSITNDSTPPVTVSASDDGSGIPDGTEVTIDVIAFNGSDESFGENIVTSVTATLTNGTATVDLTSLPDGWYWLQAHVQDQAGNENVSAPAFVLIDTAAPVLDVPEDITVNNSPGQAGANVSFTITATDSVRFNASQSQTVVLTASDTFSYTLIDAFGNVIYSSNENGPYVVLDINPASGSFFGLGTTQVTASATDYAGNSVSKTFNVTVLDAESPSIEPAGPSDGAIVVGTTSLGALSSDNQSVTSVDFYVDGKLIETDNDGSDGWGISFDTTTLGDGNHTWSATARDAAGNETSTAAASFTVNNLPPAIEMGGNAVVGVGEQFERSGFFTDLVGFWTGTVNYGDGTVINVVDEGGSPGDLPLSLNEDKTFHLSHAYTKEGDFQVTVTISDGHHTTSKVIFVHTVIGSGSNVGQSETQTATPDTPAQTSEIKGNNEATAQGALELGTGATAPATLWIASYHNDPASDPSQPPQGNIQLAGQQATAVAFFDVRITGVEENSGAHATLTFKFEVDHDAADPVLLFKDAAGNWVEIAGNPTVVTREASAAHPGMDLVTFVVTIDDFSTPKISELGGTVFTVAVPSPAGSTTTTTATVPTTTTVASTSSTGVSGVPFPVMNTATFTSTNQLTLVLRVSQGSESSSSTTTLGVNSVAGNLTEDGGDLNQGENAGRTGVRPAGLRNLSDVDFLQQEFNVEWLWNMMNGGQPQAQPVVPAAPAQNQPQGNVNNQTPATPEEVELAPARAEDIFFAELGREGSAIFTVDGGSEWLAENRDTRVDCGLAMAAAIAGIVATPRLPKKSSKRRRSPALAHV